MKNYFLLCVSVAALIGAGCASTTPPPEVPPSSQPSAPGSASRNAPPSSVPPTTTPSGIALPAIDATWKTYENGALKFSFQWPTRGRYAPTWDVSFVKEADAKTSGCASTLTVDGVAFCHVSSDEVAAGGRSFTDTYDAKINATYVRVTFTKRAGSGPEFDPAAYRAQLDQIIGTFKIGS